LQKVGEVFEGSFEGWGIFRSPLFEAGSFRSLIMGTKLFKVVRKVWSCVYGTFRPSIPPRIPKGALLRAHLGMMIEVKFLLELRDLLI
jgi:hypothetical protein